MWTFEFDVESSSTINKGKIGFISEKIYNKEFSPPNASYGSILPQKSLKFQVTV